MPRSTTVAAKSLTHELLPNFLIAGAAKAGTTSLYEYIRQHPDIFMPSRVKEPGYFRNPVGDWVPPMSFETYLDLFKDGSGKKAIGEASTAYLTSEESPELIRATLGDVKIIIGLRNPAKRAFSLYLYNLMNGWEDADTFEKAIDKEPQRLKEPMPHVFYYFNSGLYFQQVKRYFDVFGRDRVIVYLFEDLVKRPLSVCKEVFDFLNVDSQFTPTIEVHNESKKPASIALQYWLYTKAEELKLLPGWFPCRLFRTYRKLMKVNAFLGGLEKKPRLSEATRDSLITRYRSDIRQLESLLNRDLSVWL
jgi:hypothetical protein